MSSPSPSDINPYASPSVASATDPFDHERPRFRVLAVVVGFLVDIISSNVAGFVFGIVVSVFLVVQGASLEQMQQDLTGSGGVIVGGLLIGAGGTILGGYVAAWMARQRELQHALATGIVSVVFGIAVLLLQTLSPIPLTQPAWSMTIGFMLTLPAALFGGWLRQKVAGRNRNRAPLLGGR